jgi:quercetin dioxygenase-like cupin family protein
LAERSKIVRRVSTGWQGIGQRRYKDEQDGHRDINRHNLLGHTEDEQSASVVRYFEIEPGGHSTLERHTHTHFVVVLTGNGSVILGDSVHEIGPFDCVYVAPDDFHQFHAGPEQQLGFLCIVDRERDRPLRPDDDELARLCAGPAGELIRSTFSGADRQRAVQSHGPSAGSAVPPAWEQAALLANESFYVAFASRDLKSMGAVWAGKAPVTCIHPGWNPLQSRETIMKSWQAILSAADGPEIRCLDPRAVVYGDTAVITCFEQVAETVLVATNTFIREDGTWKLVHHQAGPAASPPPVNDEEDPDSDPSPRTLN